MKLTLARQLTLSLILIVASALGCYAQTAATPAEPQSSPTPTATPSDDTYVFPTGSERFNRYVKSTVGPFSLLRTAASAGISQWRDTPEEWEQGASGYGKRFASGFGRNAIQQSVIYGLDVAMELDTGFKKSKQKEFGKRIKHALLENVTSRNKSGERVVAVPRFAGIYTSRVIAYETWYPQRYDYKDALKSGTRSILTGFGMNLIREFVIKW